MVHVFYCSRAGLTATGDQVWTQDSAPESPAWPKAVTPSGALAAGNFDRRYNADLAVSAPNERVHGGFQAARGHRAVQLIQPAVGAAAARLGPQDSPGIVGKPQHQDNVGVSMAAATFSSPTRDDLAISAPGEVSSTHPDRGVVYVLRSSASGLTAQGSQLWSLPKVGGTGHIYHVLGDSVLACLTAKPG